MKKLFKVVVLLTIVQVLLNVAPNRPFKRIPHSRPTPIEQFMTRIARIESRGNQHIVNQYGMMGLYQFSPNTVRGLGFRVSQRQFLDNENLQDSVMLTYMWANQKDLEGLINKFEGRIIKGVRITRASIIAGAHFAGSGGVRKFLTDPNHAGVTDGNGTTLIKYMSQFSDFHLPPIIL
jgi:hypothetical protein